MTSPRPVNSRSTAGLGDDGRTRAAARFRRSIRIVAGLVLAATVGACGAAATGRDDFDARPGGGLAFADSSPAGSTDGDDVAGAAGSGRASSDRTGATTSTTEPPPIELGTSDNPFVELPRSAEARAVITPSGVVLPVIDQRDRSWLVSTPCQNIRFVSDAEPVGRAHVVLDPGHGGAEPGAAGATGLTEKDLNLRVARRTAEILREAGATVILARTDDYTITAASRGHIAKAIDPALLVSIHHNGGAPAGGKRPGTIVYTKTGSPASTRFGGLFFQTLQPMLDGAAEWKQDRYRDYAEALDAHEAALAAYDRSVAARDAALVANGQVPAAATTTIPATTSTVGPGRFRVPANRQPITTTTVPPTTGPEGAPPVPVPDSVAPPPQFSMEPVREFSWAGTGNAGVRSWTRSDGEDYLAVLRHSGDVPAVLAEFLYLSNPSEEELLTDAAFVDKEAGVLADAIILYFTTDAAGSGHVEDQFDEQPIGGSGGIASCVEPPL